MAPRTPPPPGDVLRRGALSLDFDDTLVEITPTPDAWRIEAEALGGIGLGVDEAFSDPAGLRAWLARLVDEADDAAAA